MHLRYISPLFIIVAFTLLSSCSQNSDTIKSMPATPTIETTTIPMSSLDITKMKQISYNVPEGHRVTTEYSATVENGIITSVNVAMISGDHESQRYHNRFAQRIRDKVIGKKISDLNLHAIGGASLTTRAFEQFITSEFNG